MKPHRAAFAIVCCLDPMWVKLHESLTEVVNAGPALMHQADDQHDPERFMATWISSIHELTARS
jgi:hypothetical protein